MSHDSRTLTGRSRVVRRWRWFRMVSILQVLVRIDTTYVDAWSGYAIDDGTRYIWRKARAGDLAFLVGM